MSERDKKLTKKELEAIKENYRITKEYPSHDDLLDLLTDVPLLFGLITTLEGEAEEERDIHLERIAELAIENDEQEALLKEKDGEIERLKAYREEATSVIRRFKEQLEDADKWRGDYHNLLKRNLDLQLSLGICGEVRED